MTFEIDQFITDEQEELISTLKKHDVKFMLIGAIAVAYHGRPRYSQDLDFFFCPRKENTKKLFRAFNDFFDDSFETDLNYLSLCGFQIVKQLVRFHQRTPRYFLQNTGFDPTSGKIVSSA